MHQGARGEIILSLIICMAELNWVQLKMIWYLLMGVISSSEKSGLNLLSDTDQIKYQYSDLKPDPFFSVISVLFFLKFRICYLNGSCPS